MHKYRIRSGKYAGTYHIYTEDEAKSRKIRYHNDWVNCKPNEWGLTDDGYVVKCLDRYQLVNRQKQITIAYRFPFILIPAGYDVKIKDISNVPSEYIYGGRISKTRLIYDIVVENRKIDSVELFIKPHGRLEWGLRKYSRTSFSGENRSYPKRLTGRAKLFIELIRTGYDPISAYMKAFNYFHPRYDYIKVRVFKLLENPAVIQHITETGAMDDFIKELERQGITNEYLVREIKRTIDDNKVSSQVRASMIALILRVKNLIGTSKSVSLSDVKPVELPEPSEIDKALENKIERNVKAFSKILDTDYEEVDSEGD